MSCKSLIFLVFIFPFFYGAFAQKVTVSPELLLRDDYSFTLLGEVGNKILLLRNKGYTQTLSIYNEGLGFIQEIPLEFEDRKINIIGFVTSKNDFNCYYSFRSNGTEYIKSVKLSPSGETYFQDTVLTRENAYLSEYYKFAGAENDRYVTLFNDLSDSEIQLILYDNQEMEIIYDTKIKAKGISMRKDFRKIAVNNDGEVALLFEKFNTSFRKAGHQYNLMVLDKEGSASVKKIHMRNTLSNDVQLLANQQTGAFNITGLYSAKYEDVTNGYFIYTDDSLKLVPFPEEMINGLATTKAKKSAEGLQDFMLNEVIYRRDGGMLLVMESNKEFYRSTSSRTFRGGGYRSSVTDYYNEDIVVISIGKDGAFDWNTVLPKKQFSQDDDGVYSSFFIFKTPNKLRFVYNDEIKNNNTVSEYVLNPAGVFERNSVLSTAYQKLKLRLRNSIQVSNTSFLLTSERNNRLNIVKIDY